MSDTTYFAVLEGEELARALGQRVDRYQSFVRESGLYALWAKAYQTHYGMGKDGFTSHEVRRKGNKGQYATIALNHFRNLVKHYLTLASHQRAALDPLPATTDWLAEKQARIAKGVLDFYLRAHLEAAMHAAEEHAAVLGEGWVGQVWNVMLGEPALPGVEGDEAELAPMRTGDLESHAFMPMDLWRDPYARDANLPWLGTRRYVSKWDLVAQFPERREEILAFRSGVRETEVSLDSLYLQASGWREHEPEQDLVPVYEFWHARTPACPDGRHALFLSDNVLLYADVLVYPEIPVRQVAPDLILGTSFGYTSAWDLLAPQEAVNTLESIALTNQKAHGVGIILAPKGSDVSPQELSTGLALVRYTQGMEPPKLANFTGTPGEVFNNANRLVGQMETIIGVNSVVRGNPEASLKSGSALALVQAQAVQFASSFQGNITRWQEKVGQDTIVIFQLFASEPLRFEVTGEDGVADIREFTGDDIAMVRRVRVDVGNPMAKTLAGRVQLAQDLVQAGFVTNAGEYMRVLETGRLEPMTASEARQHSLIKEENERLARMDFMRDDRGQPVVEVDATGRPRPVLSDEDMPLVLVTDNHALHVQEHIAVLSSTRARRNPALQRAVLAHIREHHDVWWQATLQNPGMLELAGGQPMQAALAWAQAQMGVVPGQGPGQPGSEGQPQGGGQPPRSGGQKPKNELAMPGQEPPGEAELPRMPNMPPGAAQMTGVNPAAPGPGGQPS